MRTLFSDTKVLAGINYFPFVPSFHKDIQRGMTVIGAFLFPAALGMGFPVFLYLIVLEKEQRLIETMKINGMRMYNYWIVNFCFNLLIYNITILCFLFFGSTICGL